MNVGQGSIASVLTQILGGFQIEVKGKYSRFIGSIQREIESGASPKSAELEDLRCGKNSCRGNEKECLKQADTPVSSPAWQRNVRDALEHRGIKKGKQLVRSDMAHAWIIIVAKPACHTNLVATKAKVLLRPRRQQ